MKFNDHWALLAYPVKDEKLNGPDEKSVRRKIAKNIADRLPEDSHR